MTNQLYVLLDSEGDIVETFPENSSFDHMFVVKASVCPSGAIHRATLVIGEKQSERPQINPERLRGAVSVKVKHSDD
jgi:hypothetical protein